MQLLLKHNSLLSLMPLHVYSVFIYSDMLVSTWNVHQKPFLLRRKIVAEQHETFTETSFLNQKHTCSHAQAHKWNTNTLKSTTLLYSCLKGKETHRLMIFPPTTQGSWKQKSTSRTNSLVHAYLPNEKSPYYFKVCLFNKNLALVFLTLWKLWR